MFPGFPEFPQNRAFLLHHFYICAAIMFLLSKLISSGLNFRHTLYITGRTFSRSKNIIVSEEVASALEKHGPVVALESTIITHGMPFPDNLKCALEVEECVRQQGAIPATIAIIDGLIKVGLDKEDISRLGDVQNSRPIKTSRRDLCYVVSNGLNGGTTVSGTLLIANQTGIKVFATGGVGGVHREADKTFDVSADLTELGRCGVAVVSSGVKSILDIPKTLEYLETQGVFVATCGTASRDFPAFYTRKSGFLVPYAVETAQEAARIIHKSLELNVNSGMLFAVPVPEAYSLDEKLISGVIETALGEAKDRGIEGKNVTPFLLQRIAEITAGKSLSTNMALVKNNAEMAARISVALSKLIINGDPKGSNYIPGVSSGGERRDNHRPVVIGGSNLELSIMMDDAQIKLDGRMHPGKFTLNAGGVARNMCEALSKLNCRPEFISAIGDDSQSEILERFIPSRDLVRTVKNFRTARTAVIFNSSGECSFLAGDMEIHQTITPEVVKQSEHVIRQAPLIIFDANLSLPTIETVLEIAENHKIPVFFEPTDLEISKKPFETKHWRAVKFISPNINELVFIANYLGLLKEGDNNLQDLEEIASLARKFVKFVDNVLVTLGSRGLIVARKGLACETFLSESKTDNISVRHYPIEEVKDIVNVSGAGDCLASGIISGILENLSEETCVAVGFQAAKTALLSESPIAVQLFDKGHFAYKHKANYNTIFN